MSDTIVEPFYERLGRYIKRVRESKGMTQNAVAKKLSPMWTRQHLANVEGGRSRVLAHQIPQLEKALSLEPGALLWAARR